MYICKCISNYIHSFSISLTSFTHKKFKQDTLYGKIDDAAAAVYKVCQNLHTLTMSLNSVCVFVSLQTYPCIPCVY